MCIFTSSLGDIYGCIKIWEALLLGGLETSMSPSSLDTEGTLTRCFPLCWCPEVTPGICNWGMECQREKICSAELEPRSQGKWSIMALDMWIICWFSRPALIRHSLLSYLRSQSMKPLQYKATFQMRKSVTLEQESTEWWGDKQMSQFQLHVLSDTFHKATRCSISSV